MTNTIQEETVMVNVIVPIYHARDTLPALLDSLVAQTYKRFMVTLSQDGDGESYTDIIETYRNRGLHINLLRSSENGGPGIARQRAMDADQMSDFFMFSDADDMFFPRAVEILTHEIQVNNSNIVVSDFVVEHGDHTVQLLPAASTPVTWMHGKIYRAKYLRDNNIRFLDNLRLNEDSYFNLVAVNCTDNRHILAETTYLWRDNKNSLTRSDPNFYQKGWLYYLYSQVRGIDSIIQISHKLDINLLAATFLNVYYEFMPALYLQLDLTEAAKILEPFKYIPEVQEAIGRQEFWNYILNNLKACQIFQDNLIFYKERFCDWINKYIIAEPAHEFISNPKGDVTTA